MDFFKSLTFRVIVLVVVSLFLLYLVYFLRAAFTPLLLAFILAYIFDPLIDWFGRMRLSRDTAIAILYLVAIVAAVLSVGGFFAFVSDQIESGIAKADTGIDDLVDEPWFVRMHMIVNKKAGDPLVQQQMADKIKANINPILIAFTDIAGYLQSQVSNLFNLLSYFLLVPLYTFFLLRHFDSIIETIRSYLPAIYRNRVVDLVLQVHVVLGSFFRGRLIIGLIVTTFCSVGFWLAQCPMPVLFGLLVGVIIIIPFASIVVLLMASFATYLTTGGWGFPIAVMVIGLVAQVIETYLLTPRIIGNRLELHFLVVILSVFVFGELFGFFGVLLSVPLAAIAKIMGREFLLPTLKELASEKS